MIPYLALTFMFYYFRKVARPDLGEINTLIAQNNLTAIDAFDAMRKTLPFHAFSAAANVCLIMALLSGFGVTQDNPQLSLTIALTIASALAGALMRFSVRTALILKDAEAGKPSEEHRENLMTDLVLFPLLPVAVTLLI